MCLKHESDILIGLFAKRMDVSYGHKVAVCTFALQINSEQDMV